MLSAMIEVEAPCAPTASCGCSRGIAEVADVLTSNQQLLAISR
jgi:hypothetical protein